MASSASTKATKEKSNSSTTATPNNGATPPEASSSSSSLFALDRKAVFYMALLALQFGIQPVLTRRYTPTKITRSTVVLMQEVVKFALAGVMLHVSGQTAVATRDWSISSWWTMAVVPAALYSIQNLCALQAYQNLDALTFNVLNQTKTLSAALCCYLVMGRRQSRVQLLALLLLLLAALVMEGLVNFNVEQWIGSMFFAGDQRGGVIPIQPTHDDQDMKVGESWHVRHVTQGVVPVLMASFISGLAGALTQKSLQAATKPRHPLLFSMELCAASCILLLASLTVSSDGRQIVQDGFWKHWTWSTWIPIGTNAVGGIVVGLVTKYAGSVRKGFALIFGMLLSGVMQAAWQPEEEVTRGQMVGGLLAAASLYLHATHPPTEGKTVKLD